MMKMRMLLPLLVATLACRQPRLSAAECQRDCGGLEIPYPFGIGRGCYLENGDGDQPFSVTCNTSNAIYGALRRPTPTIKGIEVLDIDVRRGKLRVRGTVGSWCYNATTSSMGEQTSLWFDSATFRVSDTDNRLTVVGCNGSRTSTPATAPSTAATWWGASPSARGRSWTTAARDATA